MEPTSSGQARRLQLRRNDTQEFRESGSDVPVGTAASARSTQALRCFIEAIAIHTLIRQRPPTPLCRGPRPYCGENSEPGRCINKESLTSIPELENSLGQLRTSGATSAHVRYAHESGLYSAWLFRSGPSQIRTYPGERDKVHLAAYRSAYGPHRKPPAGRRRGRPRISTSLWRR
jgi:hypothetical protein